MVIETENLRIVECDTNLLKKAIEGEEQLSQRLCANIAPNWTEFGTEALKYSLAKLGESEEERGWWTYFPIHKGDNKLIGSGGYKGKPTNKGTVEIGYEITPSYRNRGLATEMVKGLVENAFRNGAIESILAHTLAQDNPSTNVLKKCGFTKVEEINDPEDGLLWKWELKRTKN